jgi:hypothetical protein
MLSPEHVRYRADGLQLKEGVNSYLITIKMASCVFQILVVTRRFISSFFSLKIHELLNSCGVQWDGVNIISLVDHSEDVVRAAEQAALKVIREKGIVDLRTPPATRNVDKHDDDDDNDPHNGTVASSATPSS